MMVSILDPFQQIVHMPEVVHSELKPLKKLHDRHPKRTGESSSNDFFHGRAVKLWGEYPKKRTLTQPKVH